MRLYYEASYTYFQQAEGLLLRVSKDSNVTLSQTGEVEIMMTYCSFLTDVFLSK